MESRKNYSYEDEEDDNADDKELDLTNEDKESRIDQEVKRNLIRNFSEMQALRFEQFRRSHFDRSVIKRCMAETVQLCSLDDKKAPFITQTMTIVMAGIAKAFVGEIVSEGRKIMDSWNESGPLRPKHIREAYRRYHRKKGCLSTGRRSKRLFK